MYILHTLKKNKKEIKFLKITKNIFQIFVKSDLDIDVHIKYNFINQLKLKRNEL